LLASAHDISDGGLATALAESGFTSDDLAADIALEDHVAAELPSSANAALAPSYLSRKAHLPACSTLRHNGAWGRA
jgi:phosphoribosylformylglycinamidine (FGAM) synthase-like enzyme